MNGQDGSDLQCGTAEWEPGEPGRHLAGKPSGLHETLPQKQTAAAKDERCSERQIEVPRPVCVEH